MNDETGSTPEIPQYQQRVITEKNELDAKILLLKKFISSPAFDRVAIGEATLLNRQLIAMGDYAAILAQRISRFPVPQTPIVT